MEGLYININYFDTKSDELISLLRGQVYMQSIEVSEKTLPQIKTVFQGLRDIVWGKDKNSPQNRVVKSP